MRMTYADLVGVLRAETRQAVADLQARMDALERTLGEPIMAYLENGSSIEFALDDDIKDPYAAGYWIPHTGAECPVPDDRQWEFTYVLFQGDAVNFGSPASASYWDWGDGSKTHWRYADPIAAKAAYEAWEAYIAQGISDIIALEYPWHDHDGSDKCPVPKRRSGERIEVRGSGINTNEGWARSYDWSRIGSWRYTQPDTRKANKWGPWVKDRIALFVLSERSKQIEFGDKGQYIRHRVRL